MLFFFTDVQAHVQFGPNTTTLLRVRYLNDNELHYYLYNQNLDYRKHPTTKDRLVEFMEKEARTSIQFAGYYGLLFKEVKYNVNDRIIIKKEDVDYFNFRDINLYNLHLMNVLETNISKVHFESLFLYFLQMTGYGMFESSYDGQDCDPKQKKKYIVYQLVPTINREQKEILDIRINNRFNDNLDIIILDKYYFDIYIDTNYPLLRNNPTLLSHKFNQWLYSPLYRKRFTNLYKEKNIDIKEIFIKDTKHKYVYMTDNNHRKFETVKKLCNFLGIDNSCQGRRDPHEHFQYFEWLLLVKDPNIQYNYLKYGKIGKLYFPWLIETPKLQTDDKYGHIILNTLIDLVSIPGTCAINDNTPSIDVLKQLLYDFGGKWKDKMPSGNENDYKKDKEDDDDEDDDDDDKNKKKNYTDLFPTSNKL